MDKTAGTVASARARYRARSTTVAPADRIGAPIRTTTGPAAATALIDLRRCIASVQANHVIDPAAKPASSLMAARVPYAVGDDAQEVQSKQGHCGDAEYVAGWSQ